jgi:hypothetical protein
MNRTEIIARLENERDRLSEAIEALTGGARRRPGRPSGRRLSAAARRRISEGMKRRWAARKKNA